MFDMPRGPEVSDHNKAIIAIIAFLRHHSGLQARGSGFPNLPIWLFFMELKNAIFC